MIRSEASEQDLESDTKGDEPVFQGLCADRFELQQTRSL